MNRAPAHKALVIDDSPSTTRIIRTMLRQVGVQDVDEAHDGATALRLIQANAYDLVLCDWNMKPIDGLAVLQAVRADPAVRDLPFIMVTSETRPERILAAKHAGANGYLVKPFDAERLQAHVQHACDLSGPAAA